MSKLIKKGKFALVVSLTISTLVWSIGLTAFTPTVFAVGVGDLIKQEGSASVYYVGSDSKRYLFPNQSTFQAWYGSGATVTTVSSDVLLGYELGGNAVARAGRLIQVVTNDTPWKVADAKVYALSNSGSIHHINTAETAAALFGSDWGARIIPVPEQLFNNYTVGAQLTSSSVLPDGFVVTDGADTYLIDGGKKRAVSAEGFTANSYKESDKITLTNVSAYTDGSAVSGSESGLFNIAGSASTATTTTTTATAKGGLTVALASESPAANVLANSTAYNPVLTVNLTAGSDASVNVTGLVIVKSGLTANSSVAGIAAFDANGKRHGNFSTSLTADNTANLVFTSDPITIPAGGTVPVTIKVNTASTATSGTMSFGIASVSAITTTATVSGTFPINGSVFSLADGANIAAATITLQTLGTSAPDVGAKDHLLTKFRITESGGNEDAQLSQLVLYNNGNANDVDYDTIVLTDQTGKELARATSAVSKYVTFNISPVYVIPRGTSKDLSIKTNIKSGSGNTIDLRIMESYDVVLTGVTSGYGILTSSSLPTAASTNRATIASGSITVSKSSGSASGKIAQGGKDIVLAQFDVKAFGEDYELRSFYYTILNVTTALSGTLKVKDSSDTALYSVAGSSAKYVTSTPSGAASANWTKITLSNYKMIKAGTTETIKFVADVSSSATTSDTYRVYVTEFYGKRQSTLDYYTASDTTSFTVNTSVPANTLTVDTASLSLSKNTSFANPTVVAGATAVKIGSHVIQASNVEAVNITSLALTLTFASGSYTNVQLKVGSELLGSAIARPTSAAANTITASLQIPAGGQKIVDVYADIGTGTGADNTLTQIGTIASTGASSGSSITSPSAVSGQNVTVSSGGTLTLEADATNTPVKQILTAGSAGTNVFKFKASANAVEDLILNKLYVGVNELAHTGGTAATSSGNVFNVTLKNKAGATLAGPKNPVNGEVEFSGLALPIPKATSVELTISVDVNGTGTITPGATVFVAPVYSEHTGAAGVTVGSGGVYASYTDAGVFTVYNISQFETLDAVRVDINGNGDFTDNTNNVNEATTYYICSISGSTFVLKATNCSGALVDPTNAGTIDGWIAPVAIASNKMLVHDVEPVISLNSSSISGTQSATSGQDIAKFDVKALGARPMLVRAISWTTNGDYVAPFAHTGILAGTTGRVTLTAITGFADTYTMTYSDSGNTCILTTGLTTLETFTCDTDTADGIVTAVNGNSKYVTAVATTGGTMGNATIALTAATNNGGIYDWKVQINDVDQTGTLYAQYGSNDTFYLVSASGLRTITGTNLTFIFTTPVEISASLADPVAVTFEINANTSAVKAGVTSGSKTAGVYIEGSKGDGEWLGGGDVRVASATLGGLRWDYSNILANYGATNSATTAGTMAIVLPTGAAAGYINSSAATTLDVSDFYRVNGNTITY